MRAVPKLYFSFLFWQAVVLLLLGSKTAGASEFDPYSVLGVTRHASQAEIKKAYKQLAKEWHPDKNKDPEAQTMFIKISQSYEILSNEERRKSYDRFGQTDDLDSQAFQSSDFSSHFTHWSRDSTSAEHLLNYFKYRNEVLPNSFRKPYLIKVTSEWCFTCIHIEPIWNETVQELEPHGVGFGVVDFGVEKLLAKYIGARHAPTILGVINGEVAYFHQSASKENLRQFVESMLPYNLVESVTDESYLGFLDAWREENKPSVLLLDESSSASFVFKLSAFAHRDFVRFGDVGLSESKRLVQQYSINTLIPSMLLFKESTEKPADFIKAKVIKKQIIYDFVDKNRFLLVPRLVNQKLFDELCPLEQRRQPRKYCVLLITGEDESFGSVKAAFLDFASSNTEEIIKFTYVSQERQQSFCDTLLKREYLIPPQVIILGRQSTRAKAVYRTVTGGWNGTDEDKLKLHKHLELLQGDPTSLNYDATLPELNDELAPYFIVQWGMAAFDYISQVCFNSPYLNWLGMMPILSLQCLITPALLILLCTVIKHVFTSRRQSTPIDASHSGIQFNDQHS
ncbi:dnaJ homolog subfamily C member 16 [Trichomycterus rosablanca]|uniref:dnaJ homolog subfamily C member 16 n=1 Tax=Trichomycterus rosablanca TaxID=2290929 RepID=UPI002F360F03